MKLPFADRSLSNTARTDGRLVAYFACKPGYHMHRLFLPQRDIVVMRRTEERPYLPPQERGRDWPNDPSVYCP